MRRSKASWKIFKLLVVTDINKVRLKRASLIHTVDEAKKRRVELKYINTKDLENPEEYLISITRDKKYNSKILGNYLLNWRR